MSDPAQAARPEAADLVDSRALMRIGNLELRARAVVEGIWNGLHRSPFHGFSAEFTEYRQYSPGDDSRHLDWRVYARSDRLFMRRYEDETNLRCHLLLDRSRSMGYGSAGYSKERYASTLAATLGWFLQDQGDAIGLMTFDEEVRDFIPARRRPGHLRRVMGAMERPLDGRSTSLSGPLERLGALVRRRGFVVCVSDLLAPIDRLEPGLKALVAAGHEVAVFQVLDPAELSLGIDRRVLVEDMETAAQVYVDPEVVRKEYIARIGAHIDSIRAICRAAGIAWRQVATDQPLDRVLADFLHEREGRGLRVRARMGTRA